MLDVAAKLDELRQHHRKIADRHQENVKRWPSRQQRTARSAVLELHKKQAKRHGEWADALDQVILDTQRDGRES